MFILKNVTKKFNNEIALDDISMTINTGLNFIIGATGSGKTTLLKIIGAMDNNYDGQVLFNNQNLKALKPPIKAQYYNQVFGFIWQDFNLIENLSVIDNILLPTYLSDKDKLKTAKNILKELKISELEHQMVAKLSGGQKQRVAIARELMKDPKVILADEPTSALDSEAIKNTMDILTTLSKKRCVIIVTHDTTLITSDAHVYEFDKGQLISAPDMTISNKVSNIKLKSNNFAFTNALKLAMTNFKSNLSKNITLLFALLLSTTFLMVSLSGNIQNTSNDAFKQLVATYGDTILDISLASSFFSASQQSNQDTGPSSNVDQKLDGLYELYQDDKRVAYALYSQPLDEIVVSINNQQYPVTSSGNVPVLNRIVAGRMVDNQQNEVLIPQSLVSALNKTNDEILNQQITINGAIYDWSGGTPVLKQVSINAIVCGIIDTSVVVDYQGKPMTYSIDDSFFFSSKALKEMRSAIGMQNLPDNFIIRANSPYDMIELKDELLQKGIIPLGQFELIEDIVRLNQQTSNQSSMASIIITILAVIVTLALSFFTALFRKREFAIYKLCGYNANQLNLSLWAQLLYFTLIANLVFVIASPLLNIFTNATLSTNILNTSSIILGMLIISLLSIGNFIINLIVASTTNCVEVLKSGNKG